MSYYVNDLEVIRHVHTAVFVPIKEGDDEIISFVLHKDRFELKEYYDFLKTVKGIVGYNVYGYDSQIIHHIMLNENRFMKMSPEDVIKEIFDFSQEVIESKFNIYPLWKMPIVYRDVYKINHYDNKNKRTSLKWIQFAINWPDLNDFITEEKIYQEIDIDDIDSVVKYNINDVLSTKAFYLKSDNQKKFAFRRAMSKKLNMDLNNASDTKVGERIMVHKLLPKLSGTEKQIKETIPTYKTIRLDEVIIPWIEFEDKRLKETLNLYKNKVLKLTAEGKLPKKAISHKVIYDDMTYVFGMGGIHAARENRNFHSDDKYVVMTSDVTSYYPNLAIKQKLYPFHLGLMFCEAYAEVFDERQLFPKGTPENYGLKIALNSVFGNSLNEHSIFYCPPMGLGITINGQLLLVKLAEDITRKGIGKVLMANTDGIEVLVERNKIDQYHSICDEWCRKTGLNLEHDQYRHIWIRDVNNYLAQKENGSIYAKGDFETEKDYHKDSSMIIVPLAVRNYLINDVPIEDTVRQHINSTPFAYWDYMIGMRNKQDQGHFRINHIIANDLYETELPKTIRYYMSKGGGALTKIFWDDENAIWKKEKLFYPHRAEIASLVDENTREEMIRNLDYSFYVKQSRKLVESVQTFQTSLIENL